MAGKLRKNYGRGFPNHDTPNNSMDVRRKQRLCLETCLLNSNGLDGGFRPRHLSRSVLSV